MHVWSWQQKKNKQNTGFQVAKNAKISERIYVGTFLTEFIVSVCPFWIFGPIWFQEHMKNNLYFAIFLSMFSSKLVSKHKKFSSETQRLFHPNLRILMIIRPKLHFFAVGEQKKKQKNAKLLA